MQALLVLFDLQASFGTLPAFRTYIVDQSVPKYQQVEGLRMKIFLSDVEGNRTGALYLWESEQALEAYLPHIGASSIQRWGVAPNLERFNVEAIVEGRHNTPDLSHVGTALETPRV